MEKVLSNRRFFWLAVVFLFFFLLGSLPIWSPDEGRFSEIAREMWTSKDFIVPQFNYIEHIEKPIFAYLLASLSMGLLGVGSLGARFPGALAAVLGIFMTHNFSRRWFNERTADLAAVILTTSAGYVLVGRYAMIDMVMTFLLTGAFFCLGTACLEQKPRFYLASYVFMGLAFITKGLIGIVLPGAAFMVFLFWTGNLGEIRRMRLGWGLLIIGVIFIPWGIAISIREPNFSYVFIMRQHFERFSTPVFGRKRPFWFFVPIFFSLAFPWSIFLPSAVLRVLRHPSPNGNKAIKFLICWFFVILFFFSIPRSKLPYYILPVCVPMAVLVGVWLGRDPKDKILKVLLRAIACISVVCLAGGTLYLYFWVKDPRALLFRDLVLLGTLCVLAGIAICSVFFKKQEYGHVFSVMACTLYILLILIVAGMFRLTPYLSTYEYAQTLKKQWQTGDEVAIFASPDHFSDLPFHLARRVIVAGSDYGTLKEALEEPKYTEDAKKWFLDAGEFVRVFQLRQNRLFCLMEEKNLGSLEHLGLRSFKVVQRGGGKLLISNEI